MDAFGYLSVLISIILGLAITQVLQGYRALLLARGRIHADPTPLIWSGLILLFAAQAWWASFGLTARQNWDFLDFAVILLQMGLLYMLSALVLPDMPAEQPIDLAGHFERHRAITSNWFSAERPMNWLSGISGPTVKCSRWLGTKVP